MTHLTRIARAALAALFLAPVGAHAQTAEPLVVRVYDFGGVDSVGLAQALRDARAILDEAGLASQWHDCTHGDKSSSPECAVPRQTGDTIVRIVRRQGSSDGSPLALGESVVESGRGVLSTVFLDLIEPIARRTGTETHTLLGRAIAHEVGHLLLGTGQHSATGLMRGIWTARELERNDERDWLFDSGEGALLRASRARVTRSPAALSATFDTGGVQDTSGR